MEKQIEKRFKKLEGRIEKVEALFGDGLSKKGKPVKCHKCGKPWLTKSKALLVSCPNCGNKVKVKDLVTCFKCKKKLEKKDSKFGYNYYFHKKCFKEFDKKARQEVDKEFKGKI